MPSLLLLLALCPLLQGADGVGRERGPARAPAPRPNILLVLIDDLGVDYVDGYDEASGFYGPTPVLDSLMDVGSMCRNAYTSPVCSPTRLSIMTGEYPHRYGVGKGIVYDACEPDLTPPVDGSYAHLPRLLADAGYRTAALGKWHMANQCNGAMLHPLLMGFETHRGHKANPDDFHAWEKYVDGESTGITTTYATTDTVNDTLEVIEAFGADPWFVYCAFNAVHLPLHVPPDDLHTFNLGTNPAEETLFRAMVEALDTEIGRLLASIRPAVLDRTVVVVMSDNGTPFLVNQDPSFAPAKGSVYEGGVNVPMYWFGPGLPAGVELDGLIQAVDLFPTFLRIAGATDVPERDGVDVLNYVAGRVDSSPRERVFVHRNDPNGPPPYANKDSKAARDDRYKVIRDDEAGGQVLFYDLLLDPLEDTPVQEPLSPTYQAARDELLDFIESLL